MFWRTYAGQEVEKNFFRLRLSLSLSVEQEPGTESCCVLRGKGERRRYDNHVMRGNARVIRSADQFLQFPLFQFNQALSVARILERAQASFHKTKIHLFARSYFPRPDARKPFENNRIHRRVYCASSQFSSNILVARL